MRSGTQNPECRDALDETVKVLKLLVLGITPVQSPPNLFLHICRWMEALVPHLKILMLFFHNIETEVVHEIWFFNAIIIQCFLRKNKTPNHSLTQKSLKQHKNLTVLCTHFITKHKHKLGSLAALSWSGNSRENELCFQKNLGNFCYILLRWCLICEAAWVRCEIRWTSVVPVPLHCG